MTDSRFIKAMLIIPLTLVATVIFVVKSAAMIGMAAHAEFVVRFAMKNIIGMAANALFAVRSATKNMIGMAANALFVVRFATKNMIGAAVHADVAVRNVMSGIAILTNMCVVDAHYVEKQFHMIM